ncbi:MAG TPA: ABC transporter ATP-binding protein [Gemmatimonadaceae bacterium]|nr:ABC transporter ATP-binding protein [Gemmatimonadaceae bacterium]
MIELSDVEKIYASPLRQPVRAVDRLSLRIERGEVLGLAGPNGAGKSTLINLLLGYLRPTAGSVRLDGEPPRRWIERHGVGYLSELVAIPARWGVEEALTRYALLDGIPRAELPAAREAAIARLGLEEHRRKRVKELSKGTLQRLGLAQALLREHELLILDEPTHGLDPVWTADFRELVRALRHPGRAILIASHNLDELERVADRVAIIDRGRLQRVVATGARPVVGAASYRITLASGAELVPLVFPGAASAGDGVVEVRVESLAALNAGLAALIARGALVAAVAPAVSTLERHFREAVGGDAAR